jgi:hypothetical protein
MLSFYLLTLLLLRPQAPADQQPVTMPFEIIASKHMAVHIKVNGKGPYRVIFDTGAPISLISSKIGKESGLIKKDAKSMMMGMHGFHKAKELEVGGLKTKNVQVVVMDHPTVNAISEFVGPIEGIVGFPFFAKFRTAINYKDKTLTLTPSTYEPGDVMASLMATMMSGSKERKINLSPTTLWGLTVGKETSDEEDGVEVVHVFKGGVADQAGLKIGDRVLTLDHAWTDSVEDLYRAASWIKPGRTVKLKLRREGQEKTIDITPPAGM